MENKDLLEFDFLTKKWHDLATLRSYADRKYKVTSMHAYCVSEGDASDRNYTAKGKAGNDAKLADNLTRARSRVQELAFCNPWEWFVTFTLDKEKYDRYNLAKFSRDLGHFIRNYRSRNGCNVKYLLIPEKHKDGAWHMHGFLMGLPAEHLREFHLTDRLPAKIRVRLVNGKRVYTWDAYARRFGFADIEPIESNEAAGNYILKYITKDTAHSITKLNTHLFYASKGLEGAQIVYRDMLQRGIEKPDYTNEYCTVKWFDDAAAAMKCFEEGGTP